MAEENVQNQNETSDETDEPLPLQRKNLVTLIKEWPMPRKIALGVIVGLSVILFAILIIEARTADYQLLYGNLTETDAASIVNWLKGQHISYQLKNGGKNIWIPADKLYETRLDLASSGLPSGGGVGFKIFDKQSFALTDYVQKINYMRALQGELDRSISSLTPVESALVHLALPKQSLFKNEQQKTTASVIVNLKPGMTLNKRQVQGITHLVAGAVTGLNPDNVTIIGPNGIILDTEKTEDKDKLISLDMLQYQQKVEQGLEMQAQDLLDKTMGKDKSMVRVSATLDFAKVEQTQESYDPDQTAVRSEHIEQENTGTPSSGGVPGVQSNLQGNSSSPTSTKGNSTSKMSKTTNYEISKTVSKIVDPVGTIKKLSVSILVADKVLPAKGKQPVQTVPRSPQELKSLETMVSTALGLDTDRGDQINILSMPFTKQPKEILAAATVPSIFIYRYLPAAKLALIPILALLIYFFLLRPIIKTVKGEVKEHYKTVEQLEQERLGARVVEEEEEVEEEIPEEIVEDSVVTMRREISKNPIPAAFIIKKWINEG